MGILPLFLHYLLLIFLYLHPDSHRHRIFLLTIVQQETQAMGIQLKMVIDVIHSIFPPIEWRVFLNGY